MNKVKWPSCCVLCATMQRVSDTHAMQCRLYGLRGSCIYALSDYVVSHWWMHADNAHRQFSKAIIITVVRSFVRMCASAERDRRHNVNRFIIFIFLFCFVYHLLLLLRIHIIITKGHTPCQLNLLPPLDGVIGRSVCISCARAISHTLVRLGHVAGSRCLFSLSSFFRPLVAQYNHRRSSSSLSNFARARLRKKERKWNSSTDHDYRVSNRPRN